MGPLTPAAVLGPFFWLLLVYGILRLAHWTSHRNVPALDVARHHAMWAALLALLASGFFGEGHLRSLYASWGTADTTRITEQMLGYDLLAAGRPVAMMAAIYLIAQFTGPLPRSDVRVAVPSVRRLRDYLPTRLTVFVGALVLAGVVAISATSALPGITPSEEQEEPLPFDAVARVPGVHFAAVAGGAHLILVVGVLAALVVIVRRPHVPTLTYTEDSIMRRVFINRILRLTALLCVVTLVNCLEFASTGSSGQVWDVLRVSVMVLFVVTLIVVLAAHPTFSSEDVGQQMDRPSTDLSGRATGISGTLTRAHHVVLSGRRLGYFVWCIGLLPLLLVLGAPIGGLLGLTVLSLAYLIFIVVQLFAEVLLTRNLGEVNGLNGQNMRRLPAALLIPAVPALIFVVGAGWLALWLSSLPGSAPELPFWFLAYGLVLMTAVVTLAYAGSRPTLLDTAVEEDDDLRSATVRRTLLITQSAMMALSAFLISDNRNALAPFLGAVPTVADPYPAGQGSIGGIVAGLMLAALLIAVIPARRAWAGSTRVAAS